LHPVANAQSRRAEIEEPPVHSRRTFTVDAVRATGEDDALRLARQYLFDGRVVGDQLRVDAGFSHTPGDELGVLAAEVEDEDQGQVPLTHPDVLGDLLLLAFGME